MTFDNYNVVYIVHINIFLYHLHILQLPFPLPSPHGVLLWATTVQVDPGRWKCRVRGWVSREGSSGLPGWETTLNPYTVTFFLPMKGQGTHPCSRVKDNFLSDMLYSAFWMFYVLYILPAFWNAHGYLNRFWKRSIRATIVIWSSASLLSFCSSDVLRKQSDTRQTASGLHPKVPSSVISGQALSPQDGSMMTPSE